MITNCRQCNSDNIERIDSETIECLDCDHKMDSIEERHDPCILDWGEYM